MENGAGVPTSRRKGSRRAGGHYTTIMGQSDQASSAAPLCPRQNPPTTPAIVRLVGIAVTVFPVPADFEGGLDPMIQPVVEVLYVNQAMGEPLYRDARIWVPGQLHPPGE
jgi:hypothetical protein